jgi:hypothetical protein
MLSDSKRDDALKRFVQIEQRVLSASGSKRFAGNGEDTELLASSDAVAPVLRTALVINWRESAMKVRYERFRRQFPEIDSLAALKAAIDRTKPLDFCRTYLQINADPANPVANPKYRLLTTLTNAFLSYQASLGFQTEIEAMRDWAERVDLSNLRNDPIGMHKHVGPGTVENIRLNLGLPVVKPDRHVISTVKSALGIDVKPNEYTLLARALQQDPRYFDYILFEHGRLTSRQSSKKASPP